MAIRSSAVAPALIVAVEDPASSPDVLALLDRHLAFAATHSPPEHVHAVGVERLIEPSVAFVAVRRDGELLGVGALRRLDDEHAELKSMHTTKAARGRGVGRAVLDHLLDLAAARGHTRVSIETGTMDAFSPARALYASAGFRPCPPFAEYTSNPYSTCMTLALGVRGGCSSPRPG